MTASLSASLSLVAKSGSWRKNTAKHGWKTRAFQGADSERLADYGISISGKEKVIVLNHAVRTQKTTQAIFLDRKASRDRARAKKK